MSVFRVEKNKNYTVISNYHLRDKNLSLKSIGLLSLILSLPENWDYSQTGLAAICKDGEDSIRSGLKELEKYGYLHRERVRDESGKMRGILYHVYEVPQCSDGPQVSQIAERSARVSRNKCNDTRPQMPSQEAPPKRANPIVDNPILDSPTVDQPMAAEGRQIITKNTIKEGINIDKTINPSINLVKKNDDGRIDRDKMRLMIKENIGYDFFVFKCNELETKQESGDISIDEFDRAISQYDTETLDRIIEYMLDILTSINDDPIKIGNELISREVVKAKIMRTSIRDVKCAILELNTNPSIKNPKKYAISMLYNA